MIESGTLILRQSGICHPDHCYRAQGQAPKCAGTVALAAPTTLEYSPLQSQIGKKIWPEKFCFFF